MTHDDKRNMVTFIEACLELLGTDACASGAHVGMAYRAWVDDPHVTDAEVADGLLAAIPEAGLRVIVFGRSPWIYGAQLSPIGCDMVSEGVVMHLTRECPKEAQ